MRAVTRTQAKCYCEKMSERHPRRHHIQPQVLLRRFADSRNQIRVVQKATGVSRTTAVRNVSLIKDANTLDVAAGRDYSLESTLSKVEGFCPRIVESLDHSPRTSEEDAFILALVTTQMARDPFHRAWVGEEVARTYDALRVALREENPSISDADIQAETEHYAKVNLVKSHIGHGHRNIAIAATFTLLQAYYDSLQPYELTILRAPERSFILAGSPLSIYDRYALAGTQETSTDYSFHAETEIVFPITSRHAALITAGKLRPLIDVTPDIVAIVNARTVRAAAREIYCHPDYSQALMRTNLSIW